MISLEQIKLLEQKVEQALKKIIVLQNNNATLQTENEELKVEIELLKEQCERLEKDEEKIEQGILNVLDKLNNVEDTVRQAQGAPSTPLGTAQKESFTERQEPNQLDIDKAQNQSEDETLDDKNAESNSFHAENGTVEDPLSNIDETDESTLPSHSGMLNQATQASNLDIF